MNIKDFLENKIFIFYMLTKETKSEAYWDSYLKEHPEDIGHFESAKQAFKKMKFQDQNIKPADRELLFQRIFKKSPRPTLSRFSKYYLPAACVLFFLCLGIYTLIPPSEGTKIVVAKSTNLKTIELTTGNETFLLSNNTVLTVNEDGIKNEQGKSLKGTQSKTINTLKVPFGKRSKLVLADGSKLWLNSGSTVKFPSKFKDSLRTIYVEGEIYIEVAKNKLKPFKVETSKFNVNVYGTTFDVKAYKNKRDQRVVLVEGSVGVSTSNQMEAKMVPNEVLDISETKLSKQTVNTEGYTSWKNGYLIYNDTPMETVLLELSRYYNVSFLDTEQGLNGKTCTGKIYLSSSLEDVLETLSTLSNSSFVVKNNTPN